MCEEGEAEEEEEDEREKEKWEGILMYMIGVKPAGVKENRGRGDHVWQSGVTLWGTQHLPAHAFHF